MLCRTHILVLAVTAVLAATPLTMRPSAAAQADDRTLILIEGRVVTDDGMPLNRARIELLSDVPGAKQDAIHSSRDGRFSLNTRVTPPQRMRISKPGFVAQTLELGAIVGRIQDRGVATELTVTLTRGAVVIGSVVDERGDPVVGARVVVKFVDSGPRPRSAAEHAVDTDDRGEFRIGSLLAGDVEVTTTQVPLYGQRLDAVTGQWVFNPEVTLTTTAVRARLNAGAETFVSIRTTISFVSPSPQSSPKASEGTGALGGRILTTDGRPVRRAVVELKRSGGESVGVTQADAQGRYEVTGLAGGSYRVSVSKHGFAPAEYGQAHAAQSGSIVSVRDGQRLQNVDVALGRGSVITGRLVDVEGEPVEGVAVQVFEVVQCGDTVAVSGADGESTFRTTDDRGEYRLYGILPSTYVLTALTPSQPFTVSSMEPDSVPVYYPGTSSAASALRVAVRAGDDLRLGDTVFDPVQGSRITGRALDSSGQPLDGSAVLVTSQRSGAPLEQPRIASISNGTFEYPRVPPGQYVVQAVGGALFGGGGGEFATQLINVTGDEPVVLTMTTSAGSQLSGRIVFEGDSSGIRPADFSVGVAATDEDQSPIIGESQPQAKINDDWTFVLARMTGVFRIIASRTPDGWWLKSVTIDGVNAAEQGMVFGTPAASRSDVQIVFSRTAAGITGRTLDTKKMPVGGSSIVVFTSDATRWRTLTRRYSRLVRSDQDGRFMAGGLPPGEYFVAAFDDTDIGPQCRGAVTADLLTRLAKSARRVRLGPGERVSQDVELP